MAKHAHKRHSAKSLFLNLCTPGNYAKRARRIAERDGHLYLNGQAYLKRQIPLLESGALKPAQIEAMKKEYGAQLERNQIFLISDDACHPNAVGHELIAEELARIIAAHILS